MAKSKYIYKESFSKPEMKADRSIEFLKGVNFIRAARRPVNIRPQWIVEITASNLKRIIKRAEVDSEKAEARYRKAEELSASAEQLQEKIEEKERKLSSARSTISKLKKKLAESEERFRRLDENTKNLHEPLQGEGSPTNFFASPNILIAKHLKRYSGGLPSLGKRS